MNKLKNKKQFLAVCFLFIFIGCKLETKNKIEFAVTEDGIGEEVNRSPFLGMPLNMKKYGKSLYVSDFYGDSLLVRYNMESEVFTRFGAKGNGPNEILSPSTLSIKDKKMYVYSKSNFKLGYFDLPNEDSLISNSNYHFIFTSSSSTSEMAVLPDNSFISSGYYKEGRYAVMDEKGNITYIFGEYPDYSEGEKNRPYDVKAMFHQVIFETNHDLQKIVAVSNYIMDIIDYSNPKNIMYQRFLLNDYSYEFEKGDLLRTKKNESIPIGAISVSSSDQYIYILFNPNNALNDDFMNEIWVFDWTGKSVKKIIPDIKINLITVTPDNLIYAITQSDNPKIIKIKRQIN